MYKGVCQPPTADGKLTAPLHVGTGWGGPTDAPLNAKVVDAQGK